MKYSIRAILLLSSALLANTEVFNVSDFFSEAKTSGNVKYYYIQTDKDFTSAPSTSANANSLGGQLSFETASLYGLTAKATFMTTNGFLLSNSVDTSILGKDNGARRTAGLDAPEDTKSFSVLGEAYLAYNYHDFAVAYGRKVIQTPLIDAKVVRMLPSSVEGAFSDYKINDNAKIKLAYLDKFKQRTSDTFVDIVNHALGTKTEEVTGSSTGSVAMLGVNYKMDGFSIKAYDYYANNFMNSAYIGGLYTMKVSEIAIQISGQYLNQISIGNADTNLQDTNSITAGKKLRSNAFGLKVNAKLSSASFSLAYSKVLSDEGNHDSLVLPWDGTPLCTNMITSNDLFQSVYGEALKADSVYIGGSQGIKVAYKQSFNSFGAKGVSSTLSFLHTSNDKFLKDQRDYNIVLGYKYNTQASIALKGIWVQNSAGISASGIVSQLQLLTQYRVIAEYKF